MSNFEELGFKAGPSFIGHECPFSALIQDGGFGRLKTFVRFKYDITLLR